MKRRSFFLALAGLVPGVAFAKYQYQQSGILRQPVTAGSAASAWMRRELRETSFLRRILPPVEVGPVIMDAKGVSKVML